MAVIARKQLTGSTQKIKEYAGHEGQLVFDKQTKHLHVLSGTAGKTTELANKSDIPAPQDISGKADKTYVDQQLATKQPKGDYATNTQLTQGLAGKAPSSHTHTKSQITDFPAIPDTSTLIPKSENRGILAGYEQTQNITTDFLDKSTADSSMSGSNLIVREGADTDAFTKSVFVTGGTVNLGPNWKWVGGKAPELKFPGVLVCHWNGGSGIVNFIPWE